MKTFGEKLKELRADKKLSLDEMVAQLKKKYKTNISKSMLSRYENDKADVSLENVRMFTDFFSASPDYFIKDFINTDTLREYPTDYEVSNVIDLPIVGKISCGNGALALEDIESYEPTPKTWLNGGEYFYLRAKGDSMIGARIHDGDLLLIRKQAEVEDGEIAAVLINDEAVLKRVYKQENTLVLQSENPKYSPIIITDGRVQIVGKLKKIVINF